MMAAGLLRAWRRYWFTSTTTHHYGVFRVLFVVGYFFAPFVLPLQGTRLDPIHALADAQPEFAQPTLLLRLVDLPLSPPSGLGMVMMLLAALAAIGLFTRLSLIALALVQLYLGSVVNSFGFIAHDTTVPTIVLVVLAFAPGVTAFSLDAWWKARRERDRTWTGFGAPVYVWPARLVLLVLALAYFASGYAKVVESGLRWADGQTLSAYMTDPQPAPYFLADDAATGDATFRDGVGLESFMYSSAAPSGLARRLADVEPLMAALALSSLLWELTFPLVLVWSRLLPWYLLVGVAFHGAVVLMFGLSSFYAYLLCYLLFVDWTRVIRWTLRRLSVDGATRQAVPAG
jgi:hypothetical protein